MSPHALDDVRRRFMGRPRAALPTPALLVELRTLERNLAAMAARMAPLPAKLRPHVKSHKCVEIARRQLAAGAIGVATATAWEAVAMARAGVPDVLVANQVVGAEKIRAVAAAAGACRITVAVDDAGNAEALAAAAHEAGAEIGALVELDVGMGRCGVRSLDEAVRLGQAIARLRGLRLRGLQGYEGHCMLEPDRETREAGARVAARRLLEAAEAFRRADLPVEVVSAGGTGTFDVTGALAGITEIQAGSYALMDVFHAGLTEHFEPALRVLATVVTRQGSTVVLDAGRKTMGIDLAPARALGHELAVRGFAEEHAIFTAPSGCPLRAGDVVELVPGYAPTTVNLHDHMFVVDGEVVDVWPVVARGPGGPEDADR